MNVSLTKYNISSDSPMTRAVYRKKRLYPSTSSKLPLIIAIPSSPKFAILVRNEYCVPPILGFVTSQSNAPAVEYNEAPVKNPIIP